MLPSRLRPHVRVITLRLRTTVWAFRSIFGNRFLCIKWTALRLSANLRQVQVYAPDDFTSLSPPTMPILSLRQAAARVVEVQKRNAVDAHLPAAKVEEKIVLSAWRLRQVSCLSWRDCKYCDRCGAWRWRALRSRNINNHFACSWHAPRGNAEGASL